MPSSLPRTLALVAIAIAIGGCGDTPSNLRPNAPGDPYPVLEAATQPAGSPLADGLVVPRRAVLLGTVFRFRAHDQSFSGWRAQLVVDTGRPLDALRDLASQIEGRGHPLNAPKGANNDRPGPTDRQPCFARIASTGHTPVGERMPDNTKEIRCDLLAGPGRESSTVTLVLHHGNDARSGKSFSHLLVTARSSAAEPALATNIRAKEIPAPPSNVDLAPATRPESNDPAGSDVDPADLEKGLVIPSGAEAVAPFSLGSCTAGGFQGVLRADDVRGVLADLERQLLANGFESLPMEEWTPSTGTTSLQLWAGSAGAGFGNAIGVPQNDAGSGYVLVDRCPG